MLEICFVDIDALTHRHTFSATIYIQNHFCCLIYSNYILLCSPICSAAYGWWYKGVVCTANVESVYHFPLCPSSSLWAAVRGACMWQPLLTPKPWSPWAALSPSPSLTMSSSSQMLTLYAKGQAALCIKLAPAAVLGNVSLYCWFIQFVLSFSPG